MADSTSTAEWYADPGGRHEYRYWDGRGWTDNVADHGVTGTDPLPPGGPPQVARPIAPPPQPQAKEVVDLVLATDPPTARDAAVRELNAKGFRLTFHDEWNATAEKGSKAGAAFAGALAPYFRFGVQVFQGPSGETVLRLLREPTGFWAGGGLIGQGRATGKFKTVANDLISTFHDQGLLLGTTRV